MLSAKMADDFSKQLKTIEPKLITDSEGQVNYKIPEPIEIKSLADLGDSEEPVFIFVCGSRKIKFRDHVRLEPNGCTGLNLYYSKAAIEKREEQRKEDIAEKERLEIERSESKRKALIAEEVSRLTEEEKEENKKYEGQDREAKKENLEKLAENRLIEQGVLK